VRITLLLTLAIVLALTPVASAQAPIEQMRAFWVSAEPAGFHTPEQADELVANVARAGMNTIFVQVRRHGDAWYNRRTEPRAANPGLAPAEWYDPLDYLIQKAHAAGIQVHAWLVVSVACRDSDRLRGHPEHLCTAHGPGVPDPERWTTATFRGEQVGDLDFGHPEAIRHLERIVTGLIQQYPDLDGVHWDYIRFAGQTYGYNAVSLDRFNRAHGRPPGSRPDPNDPAFAQWRRDRVSELARRLYIRAKAAKPTIQVSAATITWGGIGSYHAEDWPNSAAYGRVYQDWRAWLAEGILDFAVPMHYFEERTQRTRGWYDSWLAWDRWNTGRRAIVAGTGAWLNNDSEGIAQIARAITPDGQGRQLAGVALFAYSEPLTDTNLERRRAYMDQLRGWVFGTPAVPPRWPWVFAPTTGHLQGIAAINGQVIPDARVTLFRDGTWDRELSASVDGWYGAADILPGRYTIRVEDRGSGRVVEHQVPVRVGQVTSGP
jgi:uncharacterized lipoprotein YddW (UPF0748 family)